jgi:hypothetical protein
MSSTYPPYGSTPTQLCQRCGRPLPPNEVYCNSCGMVNTPSQPNNASTQSPSGMPWGGAPSSTAQPGGQPWRQSPTQLPSNNALNSFSTPQQAYGPPNQYPTGGSNTPFGTPDQQPNSNNFFGAQAPQQPFYPQASLFPSTRSFQPDNMNGLQNGSFAQQPPMNGYQQPGFANPQAMNGYRSGDYTQQTEESSNRPKVGMILTIVIILLVVVGGSIGGYVYLKHQSTTSTTQTSSTVAPTPIPQGKPLFGDPFQNNNAGWDLTSKPGEFSVKVGNGSMVLEDDNNKLFSELIPGGRNFNDFFLTVDANLSKGTQSDGYGIYFRGASNQTFDIATYYRFELYGDGTFAIYKGTVDGTGTSTSSFLVKYSQSPVIQKQGNVNHIAISAKGPTMTFVVNGQTLKIVTDNTYSSGLIALFVSNLPNTTPGAQVTFSNLVIYPPQS